MRAVFALLLPLLLYGLNAAAQPSSGIAAFVGDWRGGSVDLITPNPLGDSLRDLEVKIVVRNDGGFTMTSLVRSTRSTEARRVRTVDFQPGKNMAFWQAQLGCDPAGEVGCVWARVDGNRLVVTSIDVDESGAIEMQVTERTLEGSGMRIHFQSYVEGKPRRELRGSLQRVQAR